ncbi:MAG: RpiB/LacA/LacB family sugar-phosphate isomerase [Candidatus Shapirobacteria bacterium]|nr:RpiB/LacA/LacB family sugar-phosphate isomerase [Candidatus Shapirobacteria bacterium]
MTNKIFIGSDHAGLNLKKEVINYFKKTKISFKDMGAYKYNKNDDYPDYAFKVAKNVSKGLGTGILICKMSGGMVIAANKVKGIRALNCNNSKEVKFAKQHNNANILVLAAAKIKNKNKLKSILDSWFKTRLSIQSRHIRRINKILKYENLHFKTNV